MNKTINLKVQILNDAKTCTFSVIVLSFSLELFDFAFVKNDIFGISIQNLVILYRAGIALSIFIFLENWALIHFMDGSKNKFTNIPVFITYLAAIFTFSC